MISFFYNWKNGAAEIRARQISRRIESKRNPKDGYENDTCIYVKIEPPEDYPENSYLDIVDGRERVPWLREHKIGVIAQTKTAYDFLKSFNDNVILIPQHHCNFERFVRTRQEVRTVGYIGGERQFELPVDIVTQRLREQGLEFKYFFSPHDRTSVVEFYKTIDIQITFRKRGQNYGKLCSPLKIINACSFGIPSVSYPERAYNEVKGHFLPARDIDELVSQVVRLKDPSLYQDYQRLELAEEYHIDKIIKHYENLDSNPRT